MRAHAQTQTNLASFRLWRGPQVIHESDFDRWWHGVLEAAEEELKGFKLRPALHWSKPQLLGLISTVLTSNLTSPAFSYPRNPDHCLQTQFHGPIHDDSCVCVWVRYDNTVDIALVSLPRPPSLMHWQTRPADEMHANFDAYPMLSLCLYLLLFSSWPFPLPPAPIHRHWLNQALNG